MSTVPPADSSDPPHKLSPQEALERRVTDLEKKLQALAERLEKAENRAFRSGVGR